MIGRVRNKNQTDWGAAQYCDRLTGNPAYSITAYSYVRGGDGTGRCDIARITRGRLLWIGRRSWFARISKHVDLELVGRLEFGSGAAAMRYEPKR
jgi:hypothetical protein